MEYKYSLDSELQGIVRADEFNKQTILILEMIAIGAPTSDIYEAIALLYESRHKGMRCSMLELEDGRLLHGGAPSMPKEYCEAVHGLKNGPDIGSCGTSTYTGKRCIVENIETDPKWANIKQYALPHGMRCCWSEPIKNSQNEVLGAFGMYYDYPASPNEEESEDLTAAARLAGLVMERDHNQKRIRELAYMDSLTKLPSRARFYQYVDDLIKTAKRYNREFSLLYIDLDDFKAINDTQGHDAGDSLLKIVANRLNEVVREGDFVARLSGDEFCIVTEGSDSIIYESTLAKHCIETVAKETTIDNVKHTPSCSIGISKYPHDGQVISQLLKTADTALYEAKSLGKNCYTFYEEELTRRAKYKFFFEKELKEAIENEQISLVYQPKFNIVFDSPSGVEALARWHHPELGYVSPVEFIDVAEKLGLMRDFTRLILTKACKQVAEWKEKEGLDIVVSVNISPSLFFSRDIVKMVKNVISETGISPRMLDLEITESVVQTNSNIAICSELKDIGVTISIDDFGVGYSSFASLKHLSIDCIKIDKYFINDMLKDPNSKYLVSSMIDIARNFNYEIVAEGVETKDELKVLKDLGCRNIQGFLFSKPLPDENLIKWWKCYQHKK